MNVFTVLIIVAASLGSAEARGKPTAEAKRIEATLYAALESQATLPTLPPQLPEQASATARERAFGVNGDAHRSAAAASERRSSEVKRARAEAAVRMNDAVHGNGNGQSAGQAASAAARDNTTKRNVKSNAAQKPPRP